MNRTLLLIAIILSFMVFSAFSGNIVEIWKKKEGSQDHIVSIWKKKTVFDITLRWDPNPESDLWRYNVYRSLNETGPFNIMLTTGTLTVPAKGIEQIGTTVDGDALTTSIYTEKDLPPGTYYYVVTALDNHGNESGYSNVGTKTVGLE